MSSFLSTPVEPEAAIDASSPPVPRLYTVREVARILQITGQNVRRLIHSGKLEGRRIGIKIRVPHEGLVKFLDASPCAGPDPRRDAWRRRRGAD
jgi:excisionase family DNA binding protein